MIGLVVKTNVLNKLENETEEKLKASERYIARLATIEELKRDVKSDKYLQRIVVELGKRMEAYEAHQKMPRLCYSSEHRAVVNRIEDNLQHEISLLKSLILDDN